MSDSLRIGTVLLRTGACVPKSVWIEKKTYSPRWEEIINLNGDDLDRQIRREHWNFFFLGGAIQGLSLGWGSAISVRRAVIRALGKSERTNCNGFEITDIHTRRFLGIRYVTIIGHSRHLQQGAVLQNIAGRTRQLRQSPAISATTTPLPEPALAR
ncbi:MAG TPA: hypothetical protein VN682_17790 [Terriglobales bacterium]|nr:hypothetical protein [Terriglobales bacterium]HXF14778.1 hypothetical protein [Terriglobales bacterium]